MVNYNQKKQEIHNLVQAGNMILEFINGEHSTFFCIQGFDPSSASSTASIDFNQMTKAVDITDFLVNNLIAVNKQDFENRFKAFLEREPKMNIKFSNTIHWKIYYK